MGRIWIEARVQCSAVQCVKTQGITLHKIPVSGSRFKPGVREYKGMLVLFREGVKENKKGEGEGMVDNFKMGVVY